MNSRKYFQAKVKISGTLVFDTAFHIGSGKEGELATKLGVMLGIDGSPVLPGSTLKGCIRSTAERLAIHLGLSACLLDGKISGSSCYTGLEKDDQKKQAELFRALTEADKLIWLIGNTCDICRLFGSPLQSSRIYISDGTLINWSSSLQIRNGVCIDRDSETARPKMLYDYEVVPAGASFEIGIEIENPTEKDLAIIAAVLGEWEDGFRLGGFTSRGLGRVRLHNIKVQKVDYSDREQLKSYLLHREMQPANSLLIESLEQILNNPGGDHAKKDD